MKFGALLNNWKANNKKAKIPLWFFVISLSLLILALPPNFHPAISTVVSQVPSENCRRADTGDPRSPSDAGIPYVISPRRTFILTNKPKLRWNAVIGAKSYDISLQKGQKTFWQTKVNTNEFLYPGEPKLEHGTEYLLLVKADNGKSSQEEKLPARGFRLLPEAQAQIVKTAIAQLNNQQTSDKIKILQSAFIYSGLELKSEAIEALQALVNSSIKEAWIYRQLGQLYWETGVSLLAETNYQEAAKLAIASQDIPEQAQISTALGDLYAAIGEEKESIKWFTQARDSHKTLGNSQRVKELDTQIEQMKSLAKGVKSSKFINKLYFSTNY